MTQTLIDTKITTFSQNPHFDSSWGPQTGVYTSQRFNHIDVLQKISRTPWRWHRQRPKRVEVTVKSD